MRRFMSREVVRVATWKSRVFILRMCSCPGYCSRCEQYPSSSLGVKSFFWLFYLLFTEEQLGGLNDTSSSTPLKIGLRYAASSGSIFSSRRQLWHARPAAPSHYNLSD